MFNVGDYVRVRTSGKTGYIRQVFPADYWNGNDHEYSVELDNGEGCVNLVERVLEYVNSPKCECGAKYTSFPQIHSYWCTLYKKEDL